MEDYRDVRKVKKQNAIIFTSCSCKSHLYKPFVQIVHVNANQWLTATNVGCGSKEVQLFDSQYSYLALDTKKQVHSSLRPEQQQVSFQADEHECKNTLGAALSQKT